MGNCKEALASFLSVAFSGNFYVPIDKEMPMYRVHSIFETLNPALILCREEEREKLLVSRLPCTAFRAKIRIKKRNDRQKHHRNEAGYGKDGSDRITEF